MDAGAACGLSVAFDGSTRTGLSADVGLPVSAALRGWPGLRARAFPAFADLRLCVFARRGSKPDRLAAGRLELRLWRNDGGREFAQRIIPYHRDVAAVDADRHRTLAVAPVGALSDRRLGGLRHVGAGG